MNQRLFVVALTVLYLLDLRYPVADNLLLHAGASSLIVVWAVVWHPIPILLTRNSSVAIGLGLILLSLISIVLIYLAWFGLYPRNSGKDFGTQFSSVLLTFFGVAVFEEVVFRFYLFRFFVRRNYTANNALLFTTIVFMFAHFQINASFIWSGAIYGLALIATRSLVTPIALHFTSNLLTSILMCDQYATLCLESPSPEVNGFSAPLIVIRAFQLLGIGLCLYVLYKRKDVDHLAFLR